jgi:hypothetical protein
VYGIVWYIFIEGSLELKLPTTWADGKKGGGKSQEKKRRKKIREEKESEEKIKVRNKRKNATPYPGGNVSKWIFPKKNT